MATLKLTEGMAKALYPTAPQEVKRILEETFPEIFKLEITDRVSDMDDIFSIGGKTFMEIVSPGDTKDEEL